MSEINSKAQVDKLEAIILAGGLGTRLRLICPNIPKPLAPIRGKPFLSYLMHYWAIQGITHFVLSVGYMYEKIVSQYGDSFQNVPISYSIERRPLGTGGALLQSLLYLKRPEDPFLTINGDTYFEVPLKQLTLEGSCTLALYPTFSSSFEMKKGRYDGIVLSQNGRIIKFGDPHSSLINGGCYVFSSRALRGASKGYFSLEKELLPLLVQKEVCFGRPYMKTFIDIGIPKDYRRCEALFKPGF